MGYEEFIETAKIIYDESLAVKAEEKLLILTDRGVDRCRGLPELREALLAVASERGYNVCTLYCPERKSSSEELPALAEACIRNADVAICITTLVFLHSASFGRVFHFGQGTRLLLLPSGFTTGQTDFVYRIMPKTREEFYDVADTTDRICAKFQNGPHKVRLTAANGTDFTFTLGSLGVFVHDGAGRTPGSAALLPGGAMAAGVDEGSANGTLVIDCCTALEKKLMTEKIVFTVKDGYAVSITGGEDAEKFVAAANRHPNADREKYCIAEFGLGFNKKAVLDGRAGEGENVYGAAHIGIGSNITFGGSVFIPGWHVDCILPNVTVEVDGEVIARDGAYLV